MNPAGPQRPKTSSGAVAAFFSSREQISLPALRHSPTSVDLSHAHIHRDTGIFLPLDPQHPTSRSHESSRLQPLHDLSRSISHVKKDLLGMVRNRIPKANGAKHNRSNSRRQADNPASNLSNMATSPTGPRREASRRHKPNDRPRRNATSLHAGPWSARDTEDGHGLSRLQAPHTWAQALGSGLGAKAAVAATRKQKLEEEALKQGHSIFYQPPSPDSGNDSAMELDSAFGDFTQGDPMQGVEGEDNLILKMLPGELFLEILEYLDFKALGRAAQVCKAWHSFANSPTVLRSAYLSKYHRHKSFPTPYIQIGGVGLGQPDEPMQDWMAMAKARAEIQRNWNNNTPRAIYFEGHTDSVYCCQFDEDKIITGSRDRTIRVWDLHTYRCIKVIAGPAYKPACSVTNERLATVRETVWAGDNLNGTRYGDSIFLVPREHHAASILCLQYDQQILVTGSSDHTCIVWDIDTFQPIARLRRHTAGVLDVCLDEDFIISCSKDLTICVWSRRTFELLKVLTGHSGPVNAVQLRGKLLASASGDGRCKLWDLDNLAGKKTEDILVRTFQSADRGLAAVEFTDDMQFVLAGGNDQVIYKFRCSDGAEAGKYSGHSGLVRSLFLDYANKRVLSGSYDQGIRVYDFDSHDTVGSYENWTTSWILAAKSDYRRIVATSQDGRVLLMDFGLDVPGARLLSSNNKESSLHDMLAPTPKLGVKERRLRM